MIFNSVKLCLSKTGAFKKILGQQVAVKLRAKSNFCSYSHVQQQCDIIRNNLIKRTVHLYSRSIYTGSLHCSSPPVYDSAFRQSVERPEEFWAEAADDVIWHKKWDKVLDNNNPPFSRWFVGGELNTTYNAVDRHVEAGHGEQVAIIYDSPITNSKQKITYKELLHEVKQFAGVLSQQGVGKGDIVLIYMPMIPQAMVAMLAIARLGGVHSLVFGGFASKELSVRINHSRPKVIVSANYGIEPTRTVAYKPILDEAIDMDSHKPAKCIIYNRPGYERATLWPGRDLDYSEEVDRARPADAVPVSANDPVYILYTSGTTGLPKAVVRPSGGHAVVLKWSMYNIYGIKPHEVWWAASDLGWVVGHSYITYAPLLNCNTTVLYEGKPVGTPDPGAFFRVIQEHDVAGMFVAPTALRAIRQQDPNGEYAKKYRPCNKFRYMFVAGEHCDHETLEWGQSVVEQPVLDNWWQTETGFAITATCVGLNMSLTPPLGAAGKPVPGWDVKIIKEDSTEEAEVDELGRILVKLPLPPCSFSTLWENNEIFKETYFTKFPGYYNTMDSGFITKDGYIAVMSRTDDVINVAGHRLSSGGMEEAMMEHEDVVEAAVIGVPDKVKGHVPIGLFVIKHGSTTSEEIIAMDVVKIVRDLIGPVASFKTAVAVPGLPKTRSGKVARNTIAAMASGKEFKIPVTIEDANVYPRIKEALKKIGFPKSSSSK